MNSDMKRLTPLSLLLIIGLGCIAPDWEDVSSDYESELNVFAFISLDETIPTFVQVRQTLGLEGSVYEFIGYDTLYNEDSSDYYIYEVTESRYAVEDADVTISDGVTEYELTLFDEDSLYEIEGWWRFNNFWSGGVYIDSFGLFVPEPNKDYFLTVTASDGRELTGEVTTPPIPEIKLESVPDSIDANTSYTIEFKPMPDHYGKIITFSENWICGAEQSGFIEKGDSTWTSSVEDCGGETWGWDQPDTLTIELYFMDNNYYEYFIKHGFDDEFVNFFIGAGGSGPAFGVEGGFGTFCAIAMDRVETLIVPRE